MRALILSLLLALSISPLRAEEPPHSGGGVETQGAFSYWVATYPVGITSSVQDLLEFSGIYVFSTGTAGTGIAYQFAATNSTTWGETFPIPHGGYFIKKRGRYIRVLGTGTSSGTVSIQRSLPAGTVLYSMPTPTPGIPSVSITASTAIDTATTTQAFWTQTPVAYNLSTTAGVAGKKYIVTIQPNFGGAAVFADFATLTYTTAINSGYGRYLPTTLTAGVAYGPYVAGFHAIIKSTTATGVSGTVSVEAVP